MQARVAVTVYGTKEPLRSTAARTGGALDAFLYPRALDTTDGELRSTGLRRRYGFLASLFRCTGEARLIFLRTVSASVLSLFQAEMATLGKDRIDRIPVAAKAWVAKSLLEVAHGHLGKRTANTS